MNRVALSICVAFLLARCGDDGGGSTTADTTVADTAVEGDTAVAGDATPGDDATDATASADTATINDTLSPDTEPSGDTTPADTSADASPDVAVPCACAHGTCAPGESTCASCDADYAGPDCDKSCDACLDLGTCDNGIAQDATCHCGGGFEFANGACSTCAAPKRVCGGSCVPTSGGTSPNDTVPTGATVTSLGQVSQQYTSQPGVPYFVTAVDVYLGPSGPVTLSVPIDFGGGEATSAPITPTSEGWVTFTLPDTAPTTKAARFTLRFTGTVTFPVRLNAYPGAFLEIRNANNVSVADTSNDLAFVVHTADCTTAAAPTCGEASEGGTASIACDEGLVVTDIVFASYGTPSGACGAKASGACHAATSRDVVRSACLGEASCSVPATNTAFGADPCNGTGKRLAFEVQCGFPTR